MSMKNTYEQIKSDIVDAIKNHDNVRRDTLRCMMADIQSQTLIANKEISEDIVIKCLQKAVKQHNDSINQFKTAGRDDLVSKEIQERDILANYLPKMLNEMETKVFINQILHDNNIEASKKNMGLIMKHLTSNIDKKIASNYLREILI